ncbi:MAG: glycosyltransferase [Patescibacteria group bacterium]
MIIIPENLQDKKTLEKPVFYDISGKRWKRARFFVWLFSILGILIIFLIGFFAYLEIGQLHSIAKDQKKVFTNQKLGQKKAIYVFDGNNYNNAFETIKQNYLYLDEVICNCYSFDSKSIVKNIDYQKIIDFVKREDTNIKLKIQISIPDEINNPTVISEAFKTVKEASEFDGIIINSGDNEKIENFRQQFNFDFQNALNINSNFTNVPDDLIEYIYLPKVNEKNRQVYKEAVSNVKTKNLIWDFEPYTVTNGQEIRLTYPELLERINNVKEKTFKMVNSIPTLNYSRRESYYFPSVLMLGEYEKFQSFGIVNPEYLSDTFKIIKKNDFGQFKDFENINFTYKNQIEGEGTFTRITRQALSGSISFKKIENDINSFTINSYGLPAKIERFGLNKTKTVLTFDDGPHPDATIKILEVLRKENVKAVFFAVGQNVELYPEIARRIVQEGHEIGNHSYSHRKLYTSSDKIIEDEIKKTNIIIEQVTGVKPRFFRVPFTDGGKEYRVEQDLRVAKIAQAQGLQISDYDSDTKDFADMITIPDYSTLTGTQILLHDLPKRKGLELDTKLPSLIANLRKSGQEVVSYKELFNEKDIPKDVVKNELSFIDDLKNKKFENMVFYKNNINLFVLSSFTYLLNIMLVMMTLRLLVVLYGKVLFRLKRPITKELPSIESLVSIVIPAYNEEKMICTTIDSILSSTYKNLEVIIVDDGSKDSIFMKAKTTYASNPNVKVYTKTNGGKGNALNFGIVRSIGEFVILVDADSIFEKEAISKLIANFHDPKVSAVAGNVDVGNNLFNVTWFRLPNFITIFQKIEYIYANLFDKKGYSPFNCTYIVPGCIGAYRRKDLIELGMLKSDTLAEDMLLSVMFLENKYKIVFEPDAYCITEAPESISQLYKQRLRWNFGTMQVVWKKRNLMFNPKHGLLGLFIFPYIVLSFIFRFIRPFLYIIAIYQIAKFVIVYNSEFVELFNQENLIPFILTFIELVFTSYSLLKTNFKKNLGLIPFILPITLFGSIFNCIISVHVVIRILKGGNVGWGFLKRKGSLVLNENES